MKVRLLFLVRVAAALFLVFAVQRGAFLAINAGHADGAPLASCLASFWHGLRLDAVTVSYILAVPLLVVALSCFWRRFALRVVLTPYWVVVALLAGTVLVADIILYWFWGAKLDANDLMYAVNPKDMLASVRWWAVVGALAALAVVVALILWLLRRATPSVVGRVGSRWWALLFVPLAAVIFLGMRGGVSESTANVSYAYFSQYPFCNHAALNPVFNMVHSIAKTEDLQNEFAFRDEKAVEDAIAPLFANNPAIGDTLLRTERPDILIVVWESGGWDMVMNDSVGPNIMRLANEGVLFSDCYANNFRTDRGLVSLLSGWMGLPTTSLMKMNDRCRRLPGLARTLSREGYATRFVYGGDVDFTNMRGYLHETGFETVLGSEAFGASRKESSWGAPDQFVLTPAAVLKAENGKRKAESEADAFGERGTENGRQPQLNVVLTLSSHEPWTVPMRRLADDRKNAFAYTDSCIGALVDSLRSLPLWDNLLVVIVPDHGVPLSSSQSTSDWRVARIPMVWTGGAVRGHKVINNRMMQSDLAATLLAQMRIEDDGFIMSRNVTAPDYGSRPRWALHCFKNGCNLIDSTGAAVRYECGGKRKTENGERKVESEADAFVEIVLQWVYQRSAKL